VAAHSVISLGVVAVVDGLVAFVGISRRRFMVAMVLVVNKWRERGERENVARICVRVW
jgi:hypothetical protein